MLHNVVDAVNGNHQEKKIKGRVVLMKKSVLDFTDLSDGSSPESKAADEVLGKDISLRLVSAVHGDSPGKGPMKGKIGKEEHLENPVTPSLAHLTPGDTWYEVNFNWEAEIGVPGAILIRNSHPTKEFFLKTITLDNVPGQGRLHFVCTSWVYPADKYKTDRIFFVNKAYLPGETPAPLIPFRVEELAQLRGNGTGELEEWDRVYDYAYYNDLGEPDRSPEFARPVLGGSQEYPYPRRGRTGRPPTQTDPETESRLPLKMSLSIYVPRDERFGHTKLSDFLYFGLKAVIQFIHPALESLFDGTPNEFDSFDDILQIYRGINLPDGPLLKRIKKNVPMELLDEVVWKPDGTGAYLRYPLPDLIKDDTSAWRTDEEFGREMLAGMNPVSIRRLQEFPPESKLDPALYGNQKSTIREDQIKDNLDGLTIDEAIKNNRMFILDHHDALMPYVQRINTTSSKIYSTRTLLFLQKDGTLKPLAIELSLPHPDGDQYGAVSKVFTPAEGGVEASIWQLAKAYAAVNDSGVHQLISHWLNTHATIEPFVIATNRQLSALHPIQKLLQPHFHDTMNINAFARQTLINAGGILEKTVFPGKYSMELSSSIYKDWVLLDHALPTDLLKRGVAVKDAKAPHGLRLLIEDYPYAVDGLKIWSAIETWVREYCSFYYKTDEMVQADTELQSWWKELREEGHGDKKDESWWPKMQNREDLISTLTIIIWIPSALHAAVNFGQYPYAGYMPNRPTVSRRFMPEPGSPEYQELEEDPEKAFLRTITPELQTLLGISLIEILSKHSSDEVYLGESDTPEWTKDEEALDAFRKFGKKLREIEDEIVEMNNDKKLKNRNGPVKMPYTLLYPTSEKGLTGKGIPNSVSMSVSLPKKHLTRCMTGHNLYEGDAENALHLGR